MFIFFLRWGAQMPNNTTFDEFLEFLADNKNKPFLTDIPFLRLLELMTGALYRQLRAKGLPRELVLRLMLWGLFYFFQLEGPITGKDEKVILSAIQAAKANACFCREDEKK